MEQRKICFLEDQNQLSILLHEMDDNFHENSSLAKNPWIHRNLENFHYIGCFGESNNLLGVMVYSIYDANIHLNFLYASSKSRSNGVGSSLIHYLLGLNLNKKVITTHVEYTLDKAINFYLKKGFTLFNNSNDELMELNNWIKRCCNYDSLTYQTKKLFYIYLN